MYQHCSHYSGGKVGESRVPELERYQHNVLWSWGKWNSLRPAVGSSPSHSSSSWRTRVSLAVQGDNRNRWWLRATEVKARRDGCTSDRLASTSTLTCVHHEDFITAVIRGKKKLSLILRLSFWFSTCDIFEISTLLQKPQQPQLPAGAGSLQHAFAVWLTSMLTLCFI